MRAGRTLLALLLPYVMLDAIGQRSGRQHEYGKERKMAGPAPALKERPATLSRLPEDVFVRPREAADEDGYLTSTPTMPELTPHPIAVKLAIESLEYHLDKSGQEYLCVGNVLLYDRPGQRRRFLSPDIILFLTPPPGGQARVYKAWEGDLPDLVAEVLSDSTLAKDLGEKKEALRPARDCGILDFRAAGIPYRGSARAARLPSRPLRLRTDRARGRASQGGRRGFVSQRGPGRCLGRRCAVPAASVFPAGERLVPVVQGSAAVVVAGAATTDRGTRAGGPRTGAGRPRGDPRPTGGDAGRPRANPRPRNDGRKRAVAASPARTG